MTIAEKINNLEQLGITRYRISQETKIIQSTLHRWYHGEHNPTGFASNVFNKYYNKKIKELTEY